MTTKLPPHRYTKLRIDEVSFVDRGASPGAKITFWKRLGAVRKTMDLNAVLDSLDDERKNVVLSAIEAAGKKTEAPAAAGGEEKKAPVEAAKAEEKPAEEKKEDEDPAIVAKALAALPASIRKRLEQADQLRERVAKMEAIEEHRVYDAKADTLAHLPVTKADLTEVLKCIELGRVVNKALGERFVEGLGKAHALIAKSLEDEAGSTGRGADQATDKITAVAKALREKQPNLTPEQAYVKALSENPALYAEYERDHPPVKV